MTRTERKAGRMVTDVEIAEAKRRGGQPLSELAIEVPQLIFTCGTCKWTEIRILIE